MGEYSTDAPLISNDDNAAAFEKKMPILKSTAKWILKGLMWVVFIIWISLMLLYPLEFMNKLLIQYMNTTSGSLFGLTGE